MKIEKAIECVENVLCATVYFDGTLTYELTIDDVDWLEMAKEALEKQTPKKVTHEATLLRCCTCPTCKNVVDKFEKWGESTVRITYDHCQICGQALDWSDEERKEND